MSIASKKPLRSLHVSDTFLLADAVRKERYGVFLDKDLAFDRALRERQAAAYNLREALDHDLRSERGMVDSEVYDLEHNEDGDVVAKVFPKPKPRGRPRKVVAGM